LKNNVCFSLELKFLAAYLFLRGAHLLFCSSDTQIRLALRWPLVANSQIAPEFVPLARVGRPNSSLLFPVAAFLNPRR